MGRQLTVLAIKSSYHSVLSWICLMYLRQAQKVITVWALKKIKRIILVYKNSKYFYLHFYLVTILTRYLSYLDTDYRIIIFLPEKFS